MENQEELIQEILRRDKECRHYRKVALEALLRWAVATGATALAAVLAYSLNAWLKLA